MKRIILLAAAIAAIATITGMTACQSDEPGTKEKKERQDIELTKAESQIVEKNNDFAFNLLKAISKNEEKNNNILISPLSATIALAMLNNGAAGTTHEEIQGTLGYGDISRDEMNGYFRKMLAAMQEIDPGVAFLSANSIWIRQEFPVLSSFTDVNKSYYDAEIRNENFSDPATIRLINGWCSNKTEGKIPEIIDEIPVETVMYLINALYFKGEWSNPFNKSNTKEEEFQNLNGNRPKIPTMNNSLSISYYKGDDFTMAELPYGNKAFSMVFLLPDIGVSLSSIVGKLDAQTWQKAVWGLSGVNIPIKIPRFKIEYDRNLNKDLKEMGMQSMFGAADFSLINPDADLFVSIVKQKTFAEVNEEGTEAAAVTVIGMDMAMDADPREAIITEFYVDRPFLYLIKEKSTGTIFFIGEMRNL